MSCIQNENNKSEKSRILSLKFNQIDNEMIKDKRKTFIDSETI